MLRFVEEMVFCEVKDYFGFHNLLKRLSNMISKCHRSVVFRFAFVTPFEEWCDERHIDVVRHDASV